MKEYFVIVCREYRQGWNKEHPTLGKVAFKVEVDLETDLKKSFSEIGKLDIMNHVKDFVDLSDCIEKMRELDFISDDTLDCLQRKVNRDWKYCGEKEYRMVGFEFRKINTDLAL